MHIGVETPGTPEFIRSQIRGAAKNVQFSLDHLLDGEHALGLGSCDHDGDCQDVLIEDVQNLLSTIRTVLRDCDHEENHELLPPGG